MILSQETIELKFLKLIIITGIIISIDDNLSIPLAHESLQIK